MASGRIKGITIEIGGDSTNLQKALKGIDKSLSDTQAKLKDVDKLLKLDPKNTELLTQKQKALKDAVDLTKVRLQALKEAQEGVAKGSDEWDAIQREIVATEQSLKDLEKQYKSFGSVAAQQIASVGKDMQDFGGKVTDAGKKLAPLSGTAAAIGTGLVKLGYDAVTGADDLNTLAKQTGMSTDSLQKLKYASDLIDVSMSDVTGALAKMKKGMTGNAKAFKDLGIEVTNADGSMRSVEDIFNDVVVTLSHIDNEVERDQAAMTIFGKSADSLAGIIDDGGEALKAYGEEAESLGLIMSGETLNSLNEVNDAIDRGKAQVGAATAELGAAVAEGLLPLVEPLTQGILKITELLQSLTPEQTQIILGVAAAVAALAPLIMVIGGVISSVGTILTLAPAVVGAISAILSPVGLVVIAVAALAVAIYTHWEDIKTWTANMVSYVSQKWDEFKKKVEAAWNNAKATISAAVVNIKAKIEMMKASIVGTANTIVTSVKAKFEAAKNAIVTPIESAKEKVRSAIDSIKSFFSNAKFEFPHIKTPHFNWEWQDIGGLAKIPKISIDWYKKAYDTPYMFNSPTVMSTSAGLKGFGDGRGSEIVYGRDQLMRDIASAGISKNDVYQAMRAALREMNTPIVLNNREIGRMLRESKV